MLAYETLEKCKEDLLAYKLSIQSVSSSSSSSSSTSTGGGSSSSSSANSATSSMKSTSSILPQATDFELILDCKSCSIQNL